MKPDTDRKGTALKVLRAQIEAGIAALDRGEFTEVDDADLEEYLERLYGPAAPAAPTPS